VLEPGEVFIPKGVQATTLHLVFSGLIVIRADRGAGSHKIFEWGAGDVSGVIATTTTSLVSTAESSPPTAVSRAISTGGATCIDATRCATQP